MNVIFAVILAGSINGNLFIKDSVTGTCLSISPNADFSWITQKEVLLPILDFAEKYNVGSDLSEEEKLLCGNNYPKVAKNSKYETRPMYTPDFSPTKNRIKVGTSCERDMIKPYSIKDSSRGYYFVTNKEGYRGLAICKK